MAHGDTATAAGARSDAGTGHEESDGLSSLALCHKKLLLIMGTMGGMTSHIAGDFMENDSGSSSCRRRRRCSGGHSHGNGYRRPRMGWDGGCTGHAQHGHGLPPDGARTEIHPHAHSFARNDTRGGEERHIHRRIGAYTIEERQRASKNFVTSD